MPKDGYLRWIDCNVCDLQKYYKKKVFFSVDATAAWARLSVRLFQKKATEAKLRVLCSTPLWQDNLLSTIVDYAAEH